MFVHVTVSFYFVASGELRPSIATTSFPPEPYQFKSVIALDATWGVFLVHLLVLTLRRLHKSAEKKECAKFWRNPWNWVDLGSCIGGLAYVIIWMLVLEKLGAVKMAALNV